MLTKEERYTVDEIRFAYNAEPSRQLEPEDAVGLLAIIDRLTGQPTATVDMTDDLIDRIVRTVNHPPVSDEKWAAIKYANQFLYEDWCRTARRYTAAVIALVEGKG